MLSYRHAFHAGNHADVLKHFVLMQVLQYAVQKDKPLYYVDTHAGAGKYALDKGYATQNAEYHSGIRRLWDDRALPPAFSDYMALIRKLNPDGQLRRYPGSPACALEVLRGDDRLRLFELHPADYNLLRQTLRDKGVPPRQFSLAEEDGFNGIKATLPPPSRRAVVLIDPPYEEKQDYRRVTDAMRDSLQRFATGTYIIWYPLLQRAEPAKMLDSLKKLELKSWLNLSLTVHAPRADGFGMYGCGLFIINPPWTLPALLESSMPYLVKTLAQDESAAYIVESRI